MKTILMSIIITICLLLSSLKAMDAKRHVLVPLDGFLFQVNTAAAISELGVAGAVSAAWTAGWRSSFSNILGVASGKGPDQKTLATKLFALLNTIEYQPCVEAKSAPEVCWQGLKTPHIVVHGYLQGNNRCSDLMQTVLSHIQKNAGSGERASLEASARIMLDPTKNAATFTPNADALNIVKELKARGHTVHVVDNWNGETFDCLLESHKTLFETINGKLFVSGKEGAVKSTKTTALLESFLEKNNGIKPEHCFCIETEPSYIAPLESKRLKHALCQDGNIAALRATLQKVGLLAE
ncbi:MAG: hypothetical protein AB7F19_01120 [Candidatus Babeliales bacterium]